MESLSASLIVKCTAEAAQLTNNFFNENFADTKLENYHLYHGESESTCLKITNNDGYLYSSKKLSSAVSKDFKKIKSCSASCDDFICESLNSGPCSLSICDSETNTETLSIISDDKILEAFKYDLETGSATRPSLKNARRQKKLKNKKYYGTGAESFRPNYFVGIQISNPDIHKAVIDVQKSLLEANRNIMPSLIDIATLHITLLVAHIQNDEQLFEACSALDHCGAILSEELLSTPVQLTFQGISNFSHKTIFAKLIEDHHYLKLQHIGHIVKEKFSEMNITIPDRKELVPHLTIAKLSKIPKGKGKPALRKIDPDLYQQFLNYEFGTQVMSGIQLLSMNKPKDQNRYYFSSREVSFDVVPVESLDHTSCCFPRQPQIPKLHTIKTSPNFIPSFSNESIMKAVIGGAAIMSMRLHLLKIICRKNFVLT